jgi:hypothetical protein
VLLSEEGIQELRGTAMRHGAQEVCDLTHYKRISHKMTRGAEEAINKLRESLRA